jgi:SAM-dependent methyltransferase
VSRVREQYEDLPYPPVDPGDERKRLVVSALDRLPVVNQYCFRGARTFDDGFRVLVAGGGTGNSAIFLAEQLRGLNAEVVYLDFSAASMGVAHERARIRGLTNIAFHRASLLDLPTLGLGAFDFINCTGVLHHLPDPDAGLRALLAALKPDGAMYLMVYGRYGRTATYMMQDLMRIVNAGEDSRDACLRNLKAALASLPGNHWVRFAEKANPSHDASGAFGDAGLYDLYLHEQDRAYTIGEVCDWLGGHGLHIPVRPGTHDERMFYRPETFVKDAGLLARLKKLPEREQWAAAELLCGHLNKHNVYACREAGTALTLADAGALLTPLDDQIAAVRDKAGKGADFEFTLASGPARIRVAVDKKLRTVLRHADGSLTAARVIEAAADDLKLSAAAVRRECLPQIELLMDLGHFYLRQPGAPIWPPFSALQTRPFC